jgi:hypothetical protein
MKQKALVTTYTKPSVVGCIKFPMFGISLRYFRGSGGTDTTVC